MKPPTKQSRPWTVWLITWLAAMSLLLTPLESVSASRLKLVLPADPPGEMCGEPDVPPGTGGTVSYRLPSLFLGVVQTGRIELLGIVLRTELALRATHALERPARLKTR